MCGPMVGAGAPAAMPMAAPTPVDVTGSAMPGMVGMGGPTDAAPAAAMGAAAAHSHAAAGAKAVDGGGGAAAGHAHGAGMAGMPGMGGAGGDAHHIIIPRTTPEDPAKAKALLAATMQAFGGLTMQNTEGSAQGGPNSSHRKVPDALAKQFAAAHPGMPVPKLIVFDTRTGTPIGAFFPGGKDKVPDLGMGTAHRHSADGPAMEHIWFTPDDLQLAFSDVAEKDRAKAAAVAARAGAGGR